MLTENVTPAPATYNHQNLRFFIKELCSIGIMFFLYMITINIYLCFLKNCNNRRVTDILLKYVLKCPVKIPRNLYLTHKPFKL